jgi:hypothetical protein
MSAPARSRSHAGTTQAEFLPGESRRLEGGGLRGGPFAGHDCEGLPASDPGAGFQGVHGGVRKLLIWSYRPGFAGTIYCKEKELRVFRRAYRPELSVFRRSGEEAPALLSQRVSRGRRWGEGKCNGLREIIGEKSCKRGRAGAKELPVSRRGLHGIYGKEPRLGFLRVADGTGGAGAARSVSRAFFGRLTSP